MYMHVHVLYTCMYMCSLLLVVRGMVNILLVSMCVLVCTFALYVLREVTRVVV